MYVKRSDYWKVVVFSFSGTVLARIWGRLLFTVGVATAAYVLMTYGLMPKLTLTTVPFSLVGVALAIFLGFRNNTAYDRYWEGRKLWGQLVNVTRSTGRQLSTLLAVGAAREKVPAPEDSSAEELAAAEALRRRAIYRMIAFTHALRHALRGESGDEELRPFLPPEDLQALPTGGARPQRVLQGLTSDLLEARQRGWLHPYDLRLIEGGVSEMTAVQGGCERIQSTPIPHPYQVLIHRIVGVYCFTLPFGIVDTVGILTPLVAGLIAYAFLGLDAIGDEIEDPFGFDPNDLPLSAISRKIEIDLRGRLGETDLPPPLEPVNGLLM